MSRGHLISLLSHYNVALRICKQVEDGSPYTGTSCFGYSNVWFSVSFFGFLWLVIRRLYMKCHWASFTLIFVFQNITDLSGAGTMHEGLEETGAMPMEEQGDGAEVEEDDIDWEEGWGTLSFIITTLCFWLSSLAKLYEILAHEDQSWSVLKCGSMSTAMWIFVPVLWFPHHNWSFIWYSRNTRWLFPQQHEPVTDISLSWNFDSW